MEYEIAELIFDFYHKNKSVLSNVDAQKFDELPTRVKAALLDLGSNIETLVSEHDDYDIDEDYWDDV